MHSTFNTDRSEPNKDDDVPKWVKILCLGIYTLPLIVFSCAFVAVPLAERWHLGPWVTVRLMLGVVGLAMVVVLRS